MTDMSVILVTGATGRPGGAVADHLLAAGFLARAFMRDPRKPRARKTVGQSAPRSERRDAAELR
jgi:uncharacterized protein YbjT (DUF2867 family)